MQQSSIMLLKVPSIAKPHWRIVNSK